MAKHHHPSSLGSEERPLGDLREHVILREMPVAIRLAGGLASNLPLRPGVRVQIEHPTESVVVAKSIGGGAVLPAVASFGAAAVGYGGEDESVSEKSECHPWFRSRPWTGALTNRPSHGHVEIRANERLRIVAVNSKAENVDIHSRKSAIGTE